MTHRTNRHQHQRAPMRALPRYCFSILEEAVVPESAERFRTLSLLFELREAIRPKMERMSLTGGWRAIMRAFIALCCIFAESAGVGGRHGDVPRFDPA